MRNLMAAVLVAAAFTMEGCAPAPPPPAAEAPRPDPTREEWYGKESRELAEMAREAAALLAKGRSAEASAIVTRAQPVQNRLLAVPQPSLAAMEAASDLDHLYASMLLSNRHYGWARMLFRKNQVRWKNWQPQTDETRRRLLQAEAAIAECDRRLAE